LANLFATNTQSFQMWINMEMRNSYKFFTNTDCEYRPCHQIDESKQPMNCLMCFCPLYHYTPCLGTPVVLDNGFRDCSNCVLPHEANNYEKIMEFIVQNEKTTNKKDGIKE
jgi:Zn-finger protein